MLELHGSRYLEPVEKLPPNRSLRDIEPTRVHLNRARDESDRGALHDELVASDFSLQDGQRLSERVASPRCGNLWPEQVHQVVAGKPPSRFDGEPDQQSEMLARAEADLFTGLREEQGSAQREKLQVRHQTDSSRRFGMLPLGTQINLVSTCCA